jgi:hypothetical protein
MVVVQEKVECIKKGVIRIAIRRWLDQAAKTLLDVDVW